MRYLPFILILALTIYALVDCLRNDDSDVPVELPKGVWIILIVVFPAIGPIAWLVVSRVTRRKTQPEAASYRPPAAPQTFRPQRTPPRRTRTVAPDDDPEFLASLNRPPRDEDAAPEGSGDAPAPDDIAPGAGSAGSAGSDDGDDEPDGPADGGPADAHPDDGPAASR